jgi:AcrR family transcriptional regulator
MSVSVEESPRRRPKQERSKAKVERILRSAKELLAEAGVAGFNTNRIAQEAGIGIGALYEYFANKQAIVDQLIDELSEVETSAILTRFEATRPMALEQAIEEVVALTFQLYGQHRAIYQSLWAMSQTVRDVGERPAERLIIAEVKRRLDLERDVCKVADTDLAAFTVFHLVESLTGRMASLPHGWSVEQCQAEIVRVVKRYLGI